MTVELISEFKTGDRVIPSASMAAESHWNIEGTVLGWNLDWNGYEVKWDDGDRDVYDAKVLVKV